MVIPLIYQHFFYIFWKPIYYKIDECTPQPKERKGHLLGISHHVGDKLTFYIFCPDTKKIVSQSTIRSADSNRGEIINKSIDKPINNETSSSKDPSVKIDSLNKISTLGEMLGRDENDRGENNNQNCNRRSSRLHSRDKIITGHSGDHTPNETHPREIAHSGEHTLTKIYPNEIEHTEDHT